jgi:hypothetical protein
VAPRKLDLTAELTGMRFRERRSGWSRDTFRSDDRRHVSMWEKSAA